MAEPPACIPEASGSASSRLLDELTRCTARVTDLSNHIGDPSLSGDQLVLELHRAVSGALAASVARVEAAQSEWQTKLAGIHKEAQQLSLATDCPLPTVPVTDPQVTTLKQQYDTAVQGILGLREEYASRRKEEQELLAKLTELEADLGSSIHMPAAPFPISGSTIPPLSRTYIDALKAELVRSSTELQRRSQALQERLEDIVDLWSTIQVPPRPGEWLDAMVCTHLQLRPTYVPVQDSEGNTAGYTFEGAFDRFLNDQGQFQIFAPPDAVPNTIAGGPTPLPARLSPTTEHLDRTSVLYETLLNQKTEWEARIQAVYDELSALWMEFDVPQDEMEAFVSNNCGSTWSAVQRYEEELAKMKEYKRDHIALFIDKGWERILRLCERARITEDECCARFPIPEFSGQLEGPGGGEEILQMLEQILTVLSEETEKKLALLELVNKYQQVLQEEQEMEERAKDPNRFKNTRGGAMLREEKIRKRVKVLKPKLEHDLLREIPAWEQQYGQVFTIDGAPYLASLQAVVAQQEEAAQSKRSRTASTHHGAARPGTAMGNRPGTTMGTRPGTAMGGRPGTAMATRPGTAMSSRTVPGTPLARPASPTRYGSNAASALKRPRIATGSSNGVSATPSVTRVGGTRCPLLRGAALDTPSRLPTGLAGVNRTYPSSSGSSAASTLAGWPHMRTDSAGSATTISTQASAPRVPAPGDHGFKPRPSTKLESYERRGGRRSGLPPRHEREAMRWADEDLAEEIEEDPPTEAQALYPTNSHSASTLAPVQPLASQQGRACSAMSNATIITHPLPAPSEALRYVRPPSPGKPTALGSPNRSGIPVPSRSASPTRSPRARYD